MSKMTTTYIGDLKTECVHQLSGTKILTDAPPDNNGKGEYFSPTDLFTVSIPSCILTIMGMVAQTQGFDIKGATAETDKVMYKDPRRVGEVHITITFPHNNYTDRQKRALQQVVETCPVSASLRSDLKKTVELKYKGE
ncbi:MAG TPA: OsmC family protein [Clostridiales bacterium]|nr:OsmC family protein [Clostridiales bacterium]HQP70666.1 OsmC family protein [Clostridiales bacterium]